MKPDVPASTRNEALFCSVKPWNAPSKERGFLDFLQPGAEDEEGVHGGEALHRALDGDRKHFPRKRKGG